MNIRFRPLKNEEEEFKQIHRWCKNKFVYEWFEQRILSMEEIKNKYKKKLSGGKQDLFIIQYQEKDIGLVQIYKFEYDIQLEELNPYQNIYEFDLFIGEEEYLSKGIGTEIVYLISKKIYSNYHADAIILRPFKRNERAVKCYEKCNYKRIKEYDDYDTLNNPEEITVLLKEKYNKKSNHCI